MLSEFDASQFLFIILFRTINAETIDKISGPLKLPIPHSKPLSSSGLKVSPKGVYSTFKPHGDKLDEAYPKCPHCSQAFWYMTELNYHLKNCC